jgi:hypothetical protein
VQEEILGSQLTTLNNTTIKTNREYSYFKLTHIEEKLSNTQKNPDILMRVLTLLHPLQQAMISYEHLAKITSVVSSAYKTCSE